MYIASTTTNVETISTVGYSKIWVVVATDTISVDSGPAIAQQNDVSEPATAALLGVALLVGALARRAGRGTR